MRILLPVLIAACSTPQVVEPDDGNPLVATPPVECDATPSYGPAVATHVIPEHPASSSLWATPRMDAEQVTADVVATLAGPAGGSVTWPLELQELWHADCGDGLQGSLVLEPGSYAAGSLTLTVSAGQVDVSYSGSGPTSEVVTIPMTYEVSSVSALGCDDHVDGESIQTALELTVSVVEASWEVGGECASGVLLSGAHTWLTPRAVDDAGQPLPDLGRPAVELVGDGVMIEPHEQWVNEFRFTGSGTVDARIDGVTVRSFEVVPAASITEVELLATNNGEDIEPGTDRALDSVFGEINVGPMAIWRGDDAVCGRPDMADFTLTSETPTTCSVGPARCPADALDLFDEAVEALATGGCDLTATHGPSGIQAAFGFTLAP